MATNNAVNKPVPTGDAVGTTDTQTLTNKTLTSPTINSPTITNATITADTVSGYTTSNSGTIYGIAVTTGQITGASTIASGALATNAVSAANLAPSAITLGYAQITSTFTTSSTSPVQVTGLTATVTIPAGGRKIKITAWCVNLSTATGAAQINMSIWDGTVGSGTQLSLSAQRTGAINNYSNAIAIAVVSPSAGSKTYNVGLATGNASDAASLNAAATYPAFILVEAI
jgi:hypothetical protein